MTVQTKTQALARPVAQQAIATAITLGAVVLALVTLYAVLLDQGALLTPVLGKASVTMNYVHEFAHDARHLLGAPCH